MPTQNHKNPPPFSIVNCTFLIVNWNFTFSAKEKDSETGLSYFGSRYYNSDLSIWLSVDPMALKYPSFSPYVYCANNPVKLVDPNGESVVIVGDDVEGALSQLQNQTKLKLSIDKDGNVSYSGKARSAIDKTIAAAVDDENITVNLIANKSNFFGDVETADGGAYMGNSYENGKVCTDQFVCTSLLSNFDKEVGDAKTGLTMVHELAESYFGGQIALENKQGSAYGGGYGSTYQEAHKKANQIAIGTRGPIGYNLPFVIQKNPIMIGMPYIIKPGTTFVQIGWGRTTNKDGM